MATDERTTRMSDPGAVDAYMKALVHPLAGLAAAVRREILDADPEIGEEIKWNAPAFFYTGPMEPFPAKEYRRHLVVFNFYRKESLRLVFWHGDRAEDRTGFLQGDYADGRRIASLSTVDELAARRKALRAALQEQLAHLR
ncbi:MAG: DUF1801 domain-containing protein [Thermoanaerobaculia bacterium]